MSCSQGIPLSSQISSTRVSHLYLSDPRGEALAVAALLIKTSLTDQSSRVPNGGSGSVSPEPKMGRAQRHEGFYFQHDTLK